MYDRNLTTVLFNSVKIFSIMYPHFVGNQVKPQQLPFLIPMTNLTYRPWHLCEWLYCNQKQAHASNVPNRANRGILLVNSAD